MLDLQYKDKKIFYPLENEMPNIIESFVAVYGEKHRDVITQKLTSLNYFFLKIDRRDIAKLLPEYIENHNSLETELKKELEQKYGNEIYLSDMSKLQNAMEQNDFTFLIVSKISKRLGLLDGIPFNKRYDKCKEIMQDEDLMQQIRDELDVILQDPLYQEYLASSEKLKEVQKMHTDYKYFEQKVDELYEEILSKLQNISEVEQDKVYTHAKTYCLYQSHSTAYAISALNEDKSDLEHFTFLPNALAPNLTTEVVIHEFGHTIDEMLVKVSGDKYISKCGFELFLKDTTSVESRILKVNDNKDYEKLEIRGAHRFYELFNEVCNDYITIKVAKHYRQTTGNKIEIDGSFSSHYSKAFPLLQEFIERHMDGIIECKMANDLNKTAGQYFGYDNLNALAELTEQYLQTITDTSEQEKQQITEQFKAKVHEIELAIQQHHENNLQYISEDSDAFAL